MLISFIVPTFNSEETIEECIKSILQQKVNKEVIVVDGSSTDNTVSILKKFNIDITIEKKKGQAAARNTGIKKSKGDYIAFVDSDVILPRDWTKSALKKITKNIEIAGVGGPGISYEKSMVSESLDILLYGKSKGEDRYTESIATMNALYKRDSIKGIFFNENLLIAEDPDFNFRLIKKGYRLLYSDKLFVYHKHPTNLKEIMKKWFIYGRYYIFPYVRNKKLIRKDVIYRITFFPSVLLFIVLSYLNLVFLYLVILQFSLIFFAYFYVGLKKCNGKMIIFFPIIHTLKQLSQMFGIFITLFVGVKR